MKYVEGYTLVLLSMVATILIVGPLSTPHLLALITMTLVAFFVGLYTKNIGEKL